MNPKRWDRVQQLFYAAVNMEPAVRSSFLFAECSSEPTLRAGVEALIDSSEDTTGTKVAESVRQVAAAALSDAPEERIGNYEVIRPLGHGGMGSVFLAVRADDHYRKQVAIKLINMAIAGPEMQRRFRAERQILADLDHPYIARMLDGGATGSGMPYVVMEYIDGSPIDVHCRENMLGVRQRLTLFRQLCEAVIYAHRNLVVHRDIKPANILVTADGSPKLLDFGIAKLMSEDAEVLTCASDRLMTPPYASPEQAQGGVITTTSDVYSLGVLLFQLLTGQMPAAGHRPDLDGDLVNVLLMAIREEPARRYNSVQQFSDDVQRYLDGFPVIARKDTWAYRAAKFSQRHRWSVTAAALFLLLLIAFSVTMALLAARISRERDIANTERRNAEQVTQFLIDSFRLADRSGTQGHTMTAKEVLDNGSDRVFKQLANQPIVQAKLMNTIGEVYGSLGVYDRAQLLLSKALQTNPTVETLSSLGELADTKGDYVAAERWYRQGLGGEHRRAETAMLQAKLASALMGSAKYAEAESLLKESLKIRQALFGLDSIPVADSAFRLGKLMSAEAKAPESETHFRQSLAIRRRLLGPENPDTVNTVSELATILYARGNVNEAGKLQMDALASHRKLYGESHILVAEDLMKLGSMKYDTGEYSQSLLIERQSAEIYRTALGPESPQLADAMIRLGNILERLGRPADAERQIQSGLAMDKKLLGEHHPATAAAEHSLVNILHIRGKNAEAEKIAYRVANWQRNQDTHNVLLAYDLVALGTMKRAQGDYKGADPDFEEARGIFRQALGEAHWIYARSLGSLGANRISLGDLKGSEAILRRAIDVIRNAQQPNPLDLSFPLVSLAQDLLLQGRAKEAEAAAREAFNIRQKLLPAMDPRFALSESVFGGCLAALHRDNEAASLLKESHRNLLPVQSDRSMMPELQRLGKFNRANR